ncbi:AAA family ATPase [Micromonospora sp. NPDC049044]|uniref:AAA family ATPase n=1 Tax=unclassified Micromonospora TaxID=2617518 RepID=UPI0033EEF998
MKVNVACLEKLIAVYDGTREAGAAVVVEGDVGSGKTALLDALAAHARDRGATVLRAVASRAQGGVPLGVFRQLADVLRVPRRRAEFARLLDEAGLAGAARPDGPDDRLVSDARVGAAIEGVGRVLFRTAESKPVVILIDDVHHADFASLRCLAYLTRRLTAAQILLVMTNCRGLQPLHPLIHADVLRGSGERIVIQMLSLLEVGELLAERLDGPVAPSLACAVRAATGGNPLLVNALIEDCRSGPSRPYELYAADEFARAVLGCLCRLDAETIQVAHAVALLDNPDSEAILPRLLGCPNDVVGRALGTLENAGVVHRLRFRHPQARTAVLSSLSREVRCELHSRAATLLHQHSAAAAVVAPHLASADQMYDSWAIPLMHEAAEQALADEDLELAQNYLHLAFDRCDDVGQRATTQFALMSTEWWINPAVAARHLDEVLAAARAGQLGWREGVKVADHLLWQGRTDDTITLMEGLQLADNSDEQLARALQNLSGSVQRVFPSLAARLGSGTIDPVPVSSPAGEETISGLREFLLAQRLDNHLMGRTLGALGALFISSGPLDAVHEVIEKGDWLIQAPTWRAVAAAIRAEVAFRMGAPAEARLHAQNALVLMPPRAWGVAIGAPLTTLINVALESRWPEDAAEFVGIPVPTAMLRSTLGWRYLSARGRFCLATGRRQEALSDFQAAHELAAALDLGDARGPAAPGGENLAGLIPQQRTAESHPDCDMLYPIGRLSDAERRVVRLAALGRTNRLIANELFVTISTVEQHLTQAYRKLGVPGRSHLHAVLELENQRAG